MAKKKGKFVLSIGDEGGILTYMQGKAVVRRLFAPTANYSDTRAFLETFEADPKAPISMLVDVMDQSYVQQSLPPVSSLSINNLIKRKMERDFASEELKGALQIGREKEGRRDWKYLFVTLSKSPQLESWLDLVMELPNQFEGIYLLPVEAENFMHRLRAGISGKKSKKKKDANPAEVEAKWQLLVAHNKVGGFRQVVLKNGKLIFARLAQPIGDNQPEVIAGNIEQEISVTIEYLKRLGYSDDQGMDVYVITSEFIKASIDVNNINASAAYLMSPHEAALKMGLDQAAEPNDQFADILMASAFATAKKRLLKLETKQQEKLNKLYMGLLAVKGGGALAIVGALGAVIYYGIMVPGAQDELSTLERQINTAEQNLAEVKEQERSLPDNLEKMTDLVSMHQLLNNLGMTPVETLRRLRSVLSEENQVLLREMRWDSTNGVLNRAERTAGGRGGNMQQQQEPEERLNLIVVFDMFGTEVGSEAFNVKIDAFNADLEEAFAGYEVELLTERPGNANKTTEFVVGKEPPDPIKEKPFFSLEYSISGTGAVEEDEEEETR